MKKLYILFSAALVLSLSACNDWLDVRPDTQQTEEDQFDNYKGFKDALTGVYMSLAESNLYGEKLSYSNIESLANLWYMSSSHESSRAEDYALSKHDYDSDYSKSAMKTIYSSLFNVIAQTNVIIRHAEETPKVFETEDTYNVILGEAYAVRAYCQFDVLRLFGQLPQGAIQQVQLPYSETAAFDEMPPYYGYDAYVKKLMEDVSKALKLLEKSDPVMTHTFSELNYLSPTSMEDDYMYFRQARFNYYAVKALQARIYLYLGDRTNAYQTAKAVINATDKNGKPVMELSGTNDIVGSAYRICPNECLLYWSVPTLSQMSSVLNAEARNKVRASNLYLQTSQLETLFEGQDKTVHNRYRYLWNREVLDLSNQRCATLIKYNYTDNENKENAMLYYQNVPAIRMSEMYLIAIETTTSLQEANELWNTYMLSHSIVLDQDAFATINEIPETLLAEYRREFYGEGQMFYTYKRNFTKSILWGEDMEEKDYIIPLPETEYNPNK